MNTVTKEQLSSTIGHFSWDFGQNFFIETEFGNFIWSSPDYYGTNIIRRFDGSLKDYIKQSKSPYVRDKGKNIVSSYCGYSWSLE